VPASFRRVPAGTRQVIRVTRSSMHCPQVYCAVIQAWARDGAGRWNATMMGGTTTAARAQIGRLGFAAPGRKREGDGRTPTGIFGIVTTFSTDDHNPGVRVRWRQRKPTSNVSASRGPYYNTWREVPGTGGGDRPAMRYGLWVDYNHGRLVPGAGRAPVQGMGSGIFIHVHSATAPGAPSAACPMTSAAQVRWLLGWLRPEANPRVMLNV
jgi:L,D-peptidoglycan transpeptidase YkuD (ErfK/YbiS/YcfS/YnhG family)